MPASLRFIADVVIEQSTVWRQALMIWRDPRLNTVNTLLRMLTDRDPELAAALEPLQGRRLAVDVRQPTLRLIVEGRDGGLWIAEGDLSVMQAADARIEGTALQLLQLLQEPRSGVDVAFHGDLAFLGDLRARLSGLQPGWSRIATLLLDEQQSTAFIKQSARQQERLRRVARTLSGSVGDYLIEESRVVIGPQELQDFCTRVDHLRADADRLAARLRLLERREP